MKPHSKTKPLSVWIIGNVHLGERQGGGLFKHLNSGLIYAGKWKKLYAFGFTMRKGAQTTHQPLQLEAHVIPSEGYSNPAWDIFSACIQPVFFLNNPTDWILGFSGAKQCTTNAHFVLFFCKNSVLWQNGLSGYKMLDSIKKKPHLTSFRLFFFRDLQLPSNNVLWLFLCNNSEHYYTYIIIMLQTILYILFLEHCRNFNLA